MRHLYVALSTCVMCSLGCSKHPPPDAVAATAACDRLSNVGQTVSGLLASGDVYAAEETRRTIPTGGYFGASEETVQSGAALYIHAAPGVTGPYLQRVLECHAAYGRSVHPSDPFHPRGGAVADVTVLAAGDSYAVELVGSDSDANEEILRRARTLASRSSAEQVSARSGPARF